MTSISTPWGKFASQFPRAEEYDQKRRRTYVESEMYKLIYEMYPKLFKANFLVLLNTTSRKEHLKSERYEKTSKMFPKLKRGLCSVKVMQTSSFTKRYFVFWEKKNLYFLVRICFPSDLLIQCDKWDCVIILRRFWQMPNCGHNKLQKNKKWKT